MRSTFLNDGSELPRSRRHFTEAKRKETDYECIIYD